MDWLLYLAIFWVACALLAIGNLFAYSQRVWPEIRCEWYERDKRFALVISAVGGPFAALVGLALGAYVFRTGWLWPWSDKARAEAGRTLL